MVVSIHDIPGTHKDGADFPATTAGSGQGAVVFVAPFKCRLTAVKLVPEAAHTGAATNYAILTLYNRGTDGSGTTALQTTNYTSGVDLAANKENSFYAPSSPPTLDEGTVLELVKSDAGTGAATPRMRVVIEYQGA